MHPTKNGSRSTTEANRRGTSASRRLRSSRRPTRSLASFTTPVCGSGENALFFAGRGQRVTGIDFLEQPIAEVKRKAKERGLDATFLVMDALHLGGLPEVFDSAIDCGTRPLLLFGFSSFVFS